MDVEVEVRRKRKRKRGRGRRGLAVPGRWDESFDFAEKIAKPGMSTTPQLSTDCSASSLATNGITAPSSRIRRQRNTPAPRRNVPDHLPRPLHLRASAQVRNLWQPDWLDRMQASTQRPKWSVERVRLAFLVPMAIVRGKNDHEGRLRRLRPGLCLQPCNPGKWRTMRRRRSGLGRGQPGRIQHLAVLSSAPSRTRQV